MIYVILTIKMFIKQINNVMNKFSNSVQDSINEEELAKVFGGNGDKSETFAHACDSRACSKRTELAGNLCTYGDGICKTHVA